MIIMPRDDERDDIDIRPGHAFVSNWKQHLPQRLLGRYRQYDTMRHTPLPAKTYHDYRRRVDMRDGEHFQEVKTEL